MLAHGLGVVGQHGVHALARIHGQLGMLAYQLHGAGAPARQRGAVDEHLPRPRALVAGEDAGESGLAGARGRGQLHPLARGYRKREVAVEQLGARVAESDAAGL